MSASISSAPSELNDEEIRERMSGNLCRCRPTSTLSQRSGGSPDRVRAVMPFEYLRAEDVAGAVAAVTSS